MKLEEGDIGKRRKYRKLRVSCNLALQVAGLGAELKKTELIDEQYHGKIILIAPDCRYSVSAIR